MICLESLPVRLLRRWLRGKIRKAVAAAAIATALFATEDLDTLDRLFGSEHLPAIARRWVEGDPTSVEIHAIHPELEELDVCQQHAFDTSCEHQLRLRIQYSAKHPLKSRLTARCTLHALGLNAEPLAPGESLDGPRFSELDEIRDTLYAHTQKD